MLTDGQVSKAGLDKQLIIIFIFLHQHYTFTYPFCLPMFQKLRFIETSYIGTCK